ncbi:MAG: sigma-54-dependent Fis family transcriptional regulator [Chitinispirillaceae bacterium]|nr:sigma-54-dependent Fis family transcriptional regulator [Chitinispirillaceae bacterium]
MAKILIIDDEENIRKTLREIMEDESYSVVVAEDGEQGITLFREEEPDVILLDIQLPKKNGLAVLEEIKAQKTGTEVIMISGHGTIDAAVKAIKLGAYHFLQKPLSMIEVKQNVRHAVLLKSQRDEIASWRQNENNRYQFIGKSASIERLRGEILKVAPTSGRVLITGESGTGKEVVAYWIHKHSPRRDGPFIKINCAAIPQNLIESELFGHEKGSFTGAVSQKAGKFEMANGGTLFLDEIGDMDMNTQTKVLRVIQESEFERVGGVKVIKVDVRIVAATHRNLEAMIAEGTFREDLFYRLNVVPIRVPALSERVEDIAMLAEHFLQAYCIENGVPPKRFALEALALLSARKLNGNIRELRNIVERLAILSDCDTISGDFVNGILETKKSETNALFVQTRPLNDAKVELERIYVKTQLDINGWDIPRTAELLGLARTNLHRKIKQLGIEKE